LGLFAGENFGKQLLEIADPEGGDVDAGLVELDAAAKVMIDKLLWWTVALKAARASGHRPELSMSATRPREDDGGRVGSSGKCVL
jgi:hypothetical protein